MFCGCAVRRPGPANQRRSSWFFPWRSDDEEKLNNGSVPHTAKVLSLRNSPSSYEVFRPPSSDTLMVDPFVRKRNEAGSSKYWTSFYPSWASWAWGESVAEEVGELGDGEEGNSIARSESASACMAEAKCCPPSPQTAAESTTPHSVMANPEHLSDFNSRSSRDSEVRRQLCAARATPALSQAPPPSPQTLFTCSRLAFPPASPATRALYRRTASSTHATPRSPPGAMPPTRTDPID